MELENGILVINSSLDNESLSTLAKDIAGDIHNIKEIQVDLESSLSSSAIFALLVSVKHTNSNISIPILEDDIYIDSIGSATVYQGE